MSRPYNPRDPSARQQDSPNSDSSSDDFAFRRHHHSHNIHYFQRRETGLQRLTRLHRKATLGPLQQWTEWEKKGRGPYHEYVHRLVEAGWSNLKDLDEYLDTDFEDESLAIAVVDIVKNDTLTHYDVLHDDIQLNDFIANVQPAPDTKCRLFLIEQSGYVASSIIEALGSTYRMDPRFYQWFLKGSKHMLSLAVRRRTPFCTLNFRVLNVDTATTTDTKSFKVSMYVDKAAENFWTGIVFFGSHSTVDLFSNSFRAPPPFDPSFTNIPAKPRAGGRTFRELYTEMLEQLDIGEVAKSPMYAFGPLFRLNCYCFNKLIYTFREEDKKVAGISELYPVNLTEEIRRSTEVLLRGGSLVWTTSGSDLEKEARERLEEDFVQTIKQSEYLWQSREKYSETHRRRNNARVAALTNAFTFLFAPISLISAIFGMNVLEISGDPSNPSIYVFFLAILGLNVVIILTLMLSVWVQIAWQQRRTAKLREVLAFTMGAHPQGVKTVEAVEGRAEGDMDGI